MSRRGRKRRFDYQAVVSFAKANPMMLHSEIASRFGTSKRTVSRVLCSHGISSNRRRIGRPIKVKTIDEVFQWEKTLHDAGLGMDRGLRINGKRILYGFDDKKEGSDTSSATRN